MVLPCAGADGYLKLCAEARLTKSTNRMNGDNFIGMPKQR